MSTVFDRERLLEQLQDASLIEELLSLFSVSIRQHIVELHEAKESRCVQSAQRAVHNIKGISGTIYCQELHRIASAVDQALKAGDMKPDEITQLQDAAQEVLDTLDSDSSSA